MHTTQLGSDGARRRDVCVLPDVRDAAPSGDGAFAGARLEPLAGDVWFWAYDGHDGLAEGFDEGLLALGRAIGARHGVGVQKKFLLQVALDLHSTCN